MQGVGPIKMMTTRPSFYFYAGAANALMALAIIPIRTTTIGQNAAVEKLLGSAPSYFGLLALLMLLLSVINPKSPFTVWMTVIIVTAGTLAHEFLQNWTGKIFDYRDLIAILCGFLTFSSIYMITKRLTKEASNESVDSTESDS